MSVAYGPYSFLSDGNRGSVPCFDRVSPEDLAKEIMDHHSIDPNGNPKEKLKRVWVDEQKECGYVLYEASTTPIHFSLGYFLQWCAARKRVIPWHETPAPPGEDIITKLKKRGDELKAALLLEETKLATANSHVEALFKRTREEDAALDLIKSHRPCLDKECHAIGTINAHFRVHLNNLGQIGKSMLETKERQVKVEAEIKKLKNEIVECQQYLEGHVLLLKGESAEGPKAK